MGLLAYSIRLYTGTLGGQSPLVLGGGKSHSLGIVSPILADSLVDLVVPDLGILLQVGVDLWDVQLVLGEGLDDLAAVESGVASCVELHRF